MILDWISDKIVKKVVQKYRPRVIWTIIAWAVAAIVAVLVTCELWVH